VTDASGSLVAELVAAGLVAREARWIVEEYAVGADRDAAGAVWAAARRRLGGEPLQYVLGHWPFRGLDLDVDARVLIPRPETEGLVDLALVELARIDCAAPVVLDLGCGSGAIGLALAAELGARGLSPRVVCVDASPGALDVARANARKHHLASVSFVRSSWFDELDPSLAGRVHLVVANPPYVAGADFASLDPVLAYEPREAIVGADLDGQPGLGDVAAIVAGAPRWLARAGALVLEHGDRHRDAVLAAAREAGLEGTDHDDLAGLPRVLVARRPCGG
jgi:release factor glutamine methyltransferase